jgi:hypothetical protein
MHLFSCILQHIFERKREGETLFRVHSQAESAIIMSLDGREIPRKDA